MARDFYCQGSSQRFWERGRAILILDARMRNGGKKYNEERDLNSILQLMTFFQGKSSAYRWRSAARRPCRVPWSA